MKSKFILIVFITLFLTSLAGRMPGAAAAAPPDELVVAGVFDYINVNNQFEIVGSIFNGTDQPVTGVQLSITATDAEGKSLLKDFFGEPVEAATFSPMLSTIRPGQAAPFEYTVYGGVEPAAYEITVADYSPAEGVQPVEVVVQNDRMVASDNGILYIVGELANKGDSAVEVSKLISAALGDKEQIISVGDSLEDGFYLAPAGDAGGDDRVPFRIAVNYGGLEQAAASWATYMEAAAVEPKAAYDISLSDTLLYQDKYGKTHLIGQVTNNSAEMLQINVIGSLYAADGTVLDVDTMTLPFYALGPGEQMPFDLVWLDIINQAAGELAKVARSQIKIDRYATTLSSTPVAPLVTANDSYEESDGWWSMTGDVTNSSDQLFYRSTVAVGLYDAEGRLIAANFGFTYANGKDNIEPGDITSYDISIYPAPDTDPASVTVKTFAQGNMRY